MYDVETPVLDVCVGVMRPVAMRLVCQSHLFREVRSTDRQVMQAGSTKSEALGSMELSDVAAEPPMWNPSTGSLLARAYHTQTSLRSTESTLSYQPPFISFGSQPFAVNEQVTSRHPFSTRQPKRNCKRPSFSRNHQGPLLLSGPLLLACQLLEVVHV